jgi:UDP-2,3-diacylglucosamine hydrolase
MTAVFLSDVHLRDVNSVKTRLVIRFLQEVASRFQRIYILGDFFDVWPGTSTYLVKTFQPVIDSLKKLVQDGHQVNYFEGNHDFRLGDFFSNSLGINVFTNARTEEWNGKRLFLAHGDLANPRDLGYRVLRYLLRRDILHWVARSVPQDWIFRLGLNTSKVSRRYSGLKRREAAIRQVYRLAAEGIFERGYDMVIMGHTHLPDDVTTVVGNRQCRYINLGDWVSHFTYLEFDGNHFYTRTHPVKAL